MAFCYLNQTKRAEKSRVRFPQDKTATMLNSYTAPDAALVKFTF